MFASDDIRNVALIGHKGSGKTQLAEAMLYVAKATAKLGKVDDKSSILDDAIEEKEHACSLETSVAHVMWGGKKINIVDTPGEGSFLADTRLALGAVDAAILVVSGKDGVQPITERVFSWTRELNLPCLVVVTKVDAENAKPDDVVSEIKTRLKVPVAVMEARLGEGPAYQGVITLRTQKAFVGKPEAPNNVAPGAVPDGAKSALENGRGRLVDDVAGTDDALTEKYLTEGDLTQAELDAGLRSAVRGGKLFPVYFASGVRPSGIVALLDAVNDLVPSPTERAPFKGTVPTSKAGATAQTVERAPTTDGPPAAFIFKTTWDQHAGHTSWVRVLSGTVKADATLLNAHTSNHERLGKILHGVGKDLKQLDHASAGDIVALPKLKATRTTHTLCDDKHVFEYAFPALPPPLFSRGVKFEAKGGEDKVGTALHRLAEEDPGLIVGQDETTREMLVSGLGSLHLEITVERIRRRIGIDCRLGPPHIAYKETITKKVTGIEGKHKKQSGGHGQFGVCYIDMEPLPRGGGFEFEDAIVGGAIPRQFIPSVEKGVVKSMARGFLAGFQMVDVKVRVYDGKYHDVDSSDAAFQMAGSKAFKAAAAQCHPVILEPIVKLQVTAPQSTTGDVIGDINSRRGRILGTDSVDDQTIVNAYVPLSEVLEYESKLKSMTQGKGTFSMSVSHLEICPPMVQDKVVKDSGFKHAEEDE
ncbi:MAG: elongation factor G [Polyangiaceae bacterium]|nr:elongation factor G [Polyangiaceae bacterium]